MAKSGTKMSKYELTRLERIKENEKMLEELFPEGTETLLKNRKPRTRREVDANSRGSGSDCLSEPSNSDDEVCTRKKSRYIYNRRTISVIPRRNPSRKARPLVVETRRMTRSMSGVGESQLVDGIGDEQDMKKIVYKTVQRRARECSEESPVEFDDVPSYPVSRHIAVIESSSHKVYDRVNGTTCHQCRQKTVDIKTVCHNKHCRGMRGQFCAPCLQNRYGESLVEALRNPEWVCPPCRKICNCSFCLPKRGKAPTGILIHLARDAGCDNVHEYLNKSNYDY